MNNGKQNAKCGSGIWFGPNDPRNINARIPGPLQSNQVGELAAIIIAAQISDPFTQLAIKTDSKYVISGLTEHLNKWEDHGWINTKNKTLFEAAAYQLRRRAAPTTFTWVKGHSGLEGNDGADTLANQGAQKEIPDAIDLSIPPNFKTQGAKLQSMTQSLAYKGIRNINTTPQRRTALINLDMTRFAINAFNDTWVSDENIWNSCKDESLTQKTRQFIYKTIQGAYKLGDFWNRIPNYETRAKCIACNHPDESMEHILLDCPSNGQMEIWNQAKLTWSGKNEDWPNVTIGLIMGCGALHKPTHTNEANPTSRKEKALIAGQSRLLKILISESAHIIWATRCDRTINGNPNPPPTMITRWHNTLNKRLHLDRLEILTKSCKKLKQRETLIQHTWTGTLTNELSLPHNWVNTREVL
ncbi:ribonuclease H-like domain-containing protein, partial [Hygrophoropsis aurantiaca]